jgi:hypothetical protein
MFSVVLGSASALATGVELTAAMMLPIGVKPFLSQRDMPLRLTFSRYPVYLFEEITSQRERPTLAFSAIRSMNRAGLARYGGSPANQLVFHAIRRHAEQTKPAWVDLSSGAALDALSF